MAARQDDAGDGVETSYLQSRVLRSVAAWHADGMDEENSPSAITSLLPTDPRAVQPPLMRQGAALSERNTVNTDTSPYLTYPHHSNLSPFKLSSAGETSARRSCSRATVERSPIEPETLLREVMQPREASIVPGYSRSLEPALVSSVSSYSSFTESSSSYTVSPTVERNLQDAYKAPGVISPTRRAAQTPPLDIDAETEGLEHIVPVEAPPSAVGALTLTRTSVPAAPSVSSAMDVPTDVTTTNTTTTDKRTRVATSRHWRRRLAVETDLVCQGRERLQTLLLHHPSPAAVTSGQVGFCDGAKCTEATMQPSPNAPPSSNTCCSDVCSADAVLPIVLNSCPPAPVCETGELRNSIHVPRSPTPPPATLQHVQPAAVMTTTYAAATTSPVLSQSPPRFSPFQPSPPSSTATPATTPARGVAARPSGVSEDMTACAMSYAAKLLEIHQLYQNVHALRFCPVEGDKRAAASPSSQHQQVHDEAEKNRPRWDRARSGNVLLSVDSLSCVADATRARQLMMQEYGTCGVDRHGDGAAVGYHVRLPLYALGTSVARGTVVHYAVHLSGPTTPKAGGCGGDVRGTSSASREVGMPRYSVGLTTNRFRGQPRKQRYARHVPLFVYRSDGSIATALTWAEDQGAAYGPCFSVGMQIDVWLDRTCGELAFGVTGTELGVAFVVSPALVSMLVPVVIFRDEGDGACLTLEGQRRKFGPTETYTSGMH